MPRKGPAPKHQVVLDPVYGSPLVTAAGQQGAGGRQASVAERIVYGALEGCRDKTGTDPVVTLKRALDNVKPAIEVEVPPGRWRDVPGAGRGARLAAAPPWRCAGWSSTAGAAARRR